MRTARNYAPGMVAWWHRAGTRIVFISSKSALNIPAGLVHYGFLQNGLVGHLARTGKRLAGTGVTA